MNNSVSAQSRVNHCSLRALTQLHSLDLEQQQNLMLQETGIYGSFINTVDEEMLTSGIGVV